MASILASNALTTAAVASAQISNTNPTTDAALLERFINVASEAIEKYCGRLFAKNATYAETLEVPRGELLVLGLIPVSTIGSIKIDGDTVSATSYELDDAAAGIVWMSGGWDHESYATEHRIWDSSLPSGALQYGTARRVIVATYSGGYVLPKDVGGAVVQTLPYDLEQACIQIVGSLWRRRGVDAAAPEYNSTNIAIGRGEGGLIPDIIKPQLQRYRRIIS